ncbi:protein of unknown function [Shinella sp. WSC3-e]|nr:hypothetical protein SHINE37_41398 [Rhizobiaceae bacterium]CAK7256030.1 protein of unknown function [Shinella sp. WSC3-e]
MCSKISASDFMMSLLCKMKCGREIVKAAKRSEEIGCRYVRRALLARCLVAPLTPSFQPYGSGTRNGIKGDWNDLSYGVFSYRAECKVRRGKSERSNGCATNPLNSGSQTLSSVSFVTERRIICGCCRL